METFENIWALISKPGIEWRRVNELPCVHTFVKDYYINLCNWTDNGLPMVSVDVDNVKKNIQAVYSEVFTEENRQYKDLVKTYETALERAKNVAASSEPYILKF